MSSSSLQKLRKLRGLSQTELGDAIGAHWTTISRLETGKLEMTYEWAKRLAEVLQCNPFDIMLTERRLTPVFVAFTLSEKQKVTGVRSDGNNRLSVPVPDQGHWYLVEDDSLFPQFQAGDIFHVSAVAADRLDEHLGHMCIAVGPEGAEYFGILARGRSKDSFCMRRTSAPDSEDFVPMILAKVDVVYPKPFVTKDFSPQKVEFKTVLVKDIADKLK